MAASVFVAWDANATPSNAAKDVEKTKPPIFAASGQFTALQISTTDADKLLAEWGKPTPGVQLESSSQMHRNQPIFTFIVFKGCQPDAAGKCNVTADFEMFDPAGKPYGEQKDTSVWVDLPAPPNDKIQLSQAYLGMVIENKDPTGAYEVRTSITDHIAGITVHTKETLTAVP